jgi:hypothetical protein
MSLGPVFDPSHVEHCDRAASGRRKSEEPPLLLPIVPQIPGEHDEPSRRQLDGLLADQNRANDFRREIRETHERRHMIAPHAKPRRHGVDAVITARKEYVAGCDRSGDQGGKAAVDRFRAKLGVALAAISRSNWATHRGRGVELLRHGDERGVMASSTSTIFAKSAKAIWQNESDFKTQFMGPTPLAVRLDIKNTDVTIGAATNPEIYTDMSKCTLQELGRPFKIKDLVYQHIKFAIFRA